MGDSSIARVDEFLAALPHGIDSYPDVAVKYSVIDVWTEGHDLDRLRAALPNSLTGLAEAGNPVTRWVPEVHATVVYLTLRELFFDSDDAFVADALARNHQLYRSPLYKFLLRALTARRITKSAPVAYGHMHRGTSLEVETDELPWRWTLHYPPNLVPELLGRCYATAMQAAIELGGGKNVRVEPEDIRVDSVSFSITFGEQER
ncbi:MAG: hypothetical protein AAGA54_26605 [Myxococcota bacterium]